MPDRELAKKIELHIWYRCSTPQPRILAMYVQALKDSEGAEEFHESAKVILHQSGLEFVGMSSEDLVEGTEEGDPQRTPSPNPPGYVEITFDIMNAAEKQEGNVLVMDENRWKAIHI